MRVQPRAILCALLAVVVALVLVLQTRPALADARTEARSHFKKGMELVSEKKFEEGE